MEAPLPDLPLGAFSHLHTERDVLQMSMRVNRRPEVRVRRDILVVYFPIRIRSRVRSRVRDLGPFVGSANF